MRLIVMLYGIICYVLFFGTFLYFIAFVGGFYLPRHLSLEVARTTNSALLINIALIFFWGIQHSIMARSWFKNAIEKLVPHHVERSTYVLISAIVLAIIMYYWQPMGGIVWQVENTALKSVIWGVFAFGWVLILISTFLTDHFDLFGLRQTWLYFRKKDYTNVVFTKRWFYHWIRHPMMLGMLLVFWFVPVMTMTHLVFSIGMSLYVLIGIYFEEHALAKIHGQPYVEYQTETKKMIPRIY